MVGDGPRSRFIDDSRSVRERDPVARIRRTNEMDLDPIAASVFHVKVINELPPAFLFPIRNDADVGPVLFGPRLPRTVAV